MADGVAFKVGAIVYLKSGSPPLVVSGATFGDGLVTVEWFEHQTCLRRERFDPECLIAETPELEWLRRASHATAQIKLAEFGPERMPSLAERVSALEAKVM